MTRTKGRQVRLGALFERRNETGHPEMPLLSVYRDYGVMRREGRNDNYNKPGEDLGAYRVVHRGDLVLNKMKTWQGSLGVSDHDGIVSPAYFVARPLTDDSPEYLHHLLRSPPLVGEYAARSKGIRPAQWDLPWDGFRGIRVFLPPRPTQRAIAEFLDRETARIDALIASKRRMLRLLGERFQVFREEVFNSIEIDAPRARLGRFVRSIGQGVSPEAEARSIEGDEWGVLKLSAVKRGRFIPSEHKALPAGFSADPDLVPRTGDLLVTRANTPDLVGDVCAITAPEPRLILCDLVYRLQLNQNLDTEYAAQALLTRNARYQLSSRARGTSQSMVKLRGEDIKGVELPVPSPESQRIAVGKLSAVSSQFDSVSAAQLKSIELLGERRQALVSSAVSGQFDTLEAT